jgi:imidazolonepropionase-like amidohydrolase
MKMPRIIVCFLLLIVFKIQSQTTFPLNGTSNPINTYYAFINATIVSDYENEISKATLLIQNQKIVAIGPKIDLPVGTVTVDLKGKYIYPSFIDLYSDYGLNAINTERHRNGPQMESNVKGAFGWNQAIKSDQSAYNHFVHQQEKASDFKKAGIASIVTSYKDGIVRGSGALINLNNKRENESVITDKAAGFYSFSKGSSTQDYPSSLTGAIALLRQTFYDSQWYRNNHKKSEYNISLDELNRLKGLPAVFEVNDKYNVLRASKIGNEFSINFIYKAAGNEYQRIQDIKNTNARFILPLNFPEPFDVEDPIDAESISLSDLKHWELAPTNAASFEKNNIAFCFTSFDLKDKTAFLTQIKKCIQYGLSPKMALKALTYNPASFVNAADKIGALKAGYYANFLIADKNIFEDDAIILEHWVAGEANRYADLEPNDIRGNYLLKTPDQNYAVKISGDLLKPKIQLSIDTSKKNVNYTFIKGNLNFSYRPDSNNTIRANAFYDQQKKSFTGKAQKTNGEWFNFDINFVSMVDTVNKTKPQTKKPNLVIGKVIYPFSAYGSETFSISNSKSILIKGAIVWTNVNDSALNDYDVLIVDGKINKVAPFISTIGLNNVEIINAKGKHLTPGIIDEHSHIALRSGVNEGAQASSAEVRMGDVINPEDINIYRQLSGGVTCSQLLHGSANPIGGQSALIKLKWGANAEEMKFANADGFIKFALGENVKQSNWGDNNVVRFPQSRMGVEQVFSDYFTRAKEYDLAQQKTLKVSAKNAVLAFRRDIELEALAEIINKKRFITCHSYVQSEINMLIKVADKFGFKVNTFTHILEGYKVADKMKAHGVAASTFADWWAYKNEVMDAIPYNAAILTKMGVVTAINSDDAEMARRLNQEAAKSIKYGALSEVEALKLVTLNPAKMLHISDRVGSIEVGKSADLVLWNNHPLSVFSKVEQTMIEGKIYFSREQDAVLKNEMKAEKARIIAKLLKEKQMGTKTIKNQPKQQRLYHCNTIEGLSEEETGQR